MRRANPLPILTYHGFGAGSSPTVTDPGWFRETLDALAAEGFQCVDLQAWINAGCPDVERGFALTFDDGLGSILDVADHVIHHEFQATVFVVADYVGATNDWPGQPTWVPRERLASWSDLKELALLGFQLGAHTQTHPRLGRLSGAALRDEVVGSRDQIEQHMGLPCPMFAYPYGNAPAHVRSLVAAEFQAGFGTQPGLAHSGSSVVALPRVDAYDLRHPGALRDLLSGRLAARLHAKRIIRGAKGYARSLIA